MPMKALLLGALVMASAYAQDPTALFNSAFPRRNRLGVLNNQAFCVQSQSGGPVYSHRAEVPVNIGPLSHLVTTVLALDSFPADKTWRTSFVLAGTRLHVIGGQDPWFEEEKIFALIDSLQRRGVTRLSELTFDARFTFGDSQSPAHRFNTPDDVRAALLRYFNPEGNLPVTPDSLRELLMNEGLGISMPARGIPTATVRFTNDNPLIGARGATTFNHVSEPLVRALKVMNVYNRSRIAQNLWALAYAQRAPLDTLYEYLIPTDAINLTNGTGLPGLVGPDGLGRENTAPCLAMLKVLEALEFLARERRIEVEDVVALGTDGGALKDRFGSDRALRSGLIAQGGTMGTSTVLAGWIQGAQVQRFVLLNRNNTTWRMRQFQDHFLSSWMRLPGAGPVQPAVYRRDRLAPFSGEFLR